MLSALEKRIVSCLQGDLPVTLTPYADVAKELAIEEEMLLAKVKELEERGILRRVGAVLHHREAGFTANGMCAWRVPQERCSEVGRIMALDSRASHVYQRPTYPDWPYSVFTMLHAKSREECEAYARELSEKTGVRDYILLYSVREFKKASMKYF